MQLPDSVCDLAERQLGVFARRQFPPEVPEHRVDDLLRSGRLERLHRGVYRVRGGAVHRHTAAVAAALRVGPRTVLSGPAAVELAGIAGIHLGQQFVLLVPPPRRPARRGQDVLTDRDPDREVRLLGDVRVAAPADALLDALRFASELRPRQLRLAHDQLRWAGVLVPGQLRERARALGLSGRLGDHELLELDGTAATGDGERDLGDLLAAFVPRPEPQVWVTPHRCVDWYFRGVRMGVEYQGAADHGTRAGRSADARRDAELARAGIHLIYVTARDLRDERSLLATVAGAFAARADELRVDAPQLRRGA